MKDHILVDQNAQWANRPWDAWLFNKCRYKIHYFVFFSDNCEVKDLWHNGTSANGIRNHETPDHGTMENNET
jgi:hypothetical protein